MAYVYRYTDLSDGIIKYVGVVWSENRTLSQRIREHLNDKWCKGKKWKIEFIKLEGQSRTDAEYLESHFISLFGTDKYFNTRKAGWGISSIIKGTFNWELYSCENLKTAEEYEEEIKNLKRQINDYEEKISEMSVTIEKLRNEFWRREFDISDSCNTEYIPHERELPSWITGTLFQDGESKKNKNENSSKLVEGKKTAFMGKQKNGSKHWQVPCKALLYNSKEKLIEKRFFNSLKECHEKTKLSYQQIKDSMNDSHRILYFDEWVRTVYIQKNKKGFPMYAYNNTYFIRICAVTPPMEETRFGFMNNYN